MAFESLSDKLQNIFKNLRGKGRLSEADVKAALKEVKMALLEADVSFKVVKQFISSIQERAVGEEVFGSLTPGQTVIKIVTEELVKLMGVSSETIRKDLEYLDSQGRLSRVHGGAVPADSGKPADIPGGYISL